MDNPAPSGNGRSLRSWLETLLAERFSITILLSSFLLFQIQPMIARVILPWFGGGTMIWCTCMLFFQVFLLLGYLQAHLVSSWLAPRSQGLLYGALIALTIACLDISPDPSLRPSPEADPTYSILLLLVRHVGPPYLLLASVSPLIQAWFSLERPGHSPYRLYALSNIGSLAALLSYPFLIETNFGVTMQMRLWSLGFVIFGVSMGLTGLLLARRAVSRQARAEELPAGPPPGALLKLTWVTIAAVPCMLMLAVTNHLCHDVSVTPILWVLPLSLYLLSFILTFDSQRWYSRVVYMPLFILFGLFPMISGFPEVMPLLVHIIGYGGLLFCGCMICNGELVRLKPEPRYLTSFYLSMSFGGALGGLFVALVAPAYFKGYWELQISTALVALLICVTVWSQWIKDPYNEKLRQAWGLGLAATIVLCGSLLVGPYQEIYNNKLALRNFYGVMRIAEQGVRSPRDHRYVLKHGSTIHGIQLQHPDLRRIPRSYYSENSGLSLVLEHHKKGQPRRIGVLGLGTGSIAALALPTDYVRYYEIDPDMLWVAQNWFTFLRDSRGMVDVVLGDARLSLESEKPQNFDIFVLDSFSGDAIPVHIITKEAMAIHLKHMAPDGILLVHISSRYYDLSPLVRALAIEFGLHGGLIQNLGNLEKHDYASVFYLLATDPKVLEEPVLANAMKGSERRLAPPLPPEKVWTDDYSDVMTLVGRGDDLAVTDFDVVPPLPSMPEARKQGGQPTAPAVP